MKELSIEEKAKAYDEVKNKLGRFIAQGVDPLITRADVQDFFPELKESEEENIRKDIISFVEQAIDAGYGIISKERKEKWIAWLEKQGERKQQIKLVFPKFRVGDIIKHVPFEKWDTTVKITHIDETGYYFDHSHQGDTISGGFIGFKFENDYELVEQKPAECNEDLECASWQYADKKAHLDISVFTQKEVNEKRSKSEYNWEDIRIAFKDGAQWKKSHIWHDADKEQPEQGRTVVIWNPVYKEGSILSHIVNVNEGRIWAYMDDIFHDKED